MNKRDNLYKDWDFNMAKRYCTMPKIPYFRDWYENKFGDLCAIHDVEYEMISEGIFTHQDEEDKLIADFDFACGIAQRGYFMLAILSLMAVNLPWVGKKLRKGDQSGKN